MSTSTSSKARLDRVERLELIEFAQRRADDHRAHELRARRVQRSTSESSAALSVAVRRTCRRSECGSKFVRTFCTPFRQFFSRARTRAPPRRPLGVVRPVSLPRAARRTALRCDELRARTYRLPSDRLARHDRQPGQGGGIGRRGRRDRRADLVGPHSSSYALATSESAVSLRRSRCTLRAELRAQARRSTRRSLTDDGRPPTCQSRRAGSVSRRSRRPL
jgi:hypothetical protein